MNIAKHYVWLGTSSHFGVDPLFLWNPSVDKASKPLQVMQLRLVIISLTVVIDFGRDVLFGIDIDIGQMPFL